jgi:hypothetical protein
MAERNETRAGNFGVAGLALFVMGLLIAPGHLSGQVADSTPRRSANDRMLDPGPETRQLARRVGTWEVVMRLRPTPDATPVVVTGLEAERSMIGLYLQETMRPAPGVDMPQFRRIEYLTYNPVEARWQYVSLDTRAPIGLMPARSFGGVAGDSITVYFENSALAGFGPEFEGRLFFARHVTTRESDDRDVSRQYWTRAGGPEWLAVEYEYTRKR